MDAYRQTHIDFGKEFLLDQHDIGVSTSVRGGQNTEFSEFRKEHTRIWDSYLKLVSDDIARKRVTLGEGRLLFPNLVLYTETEDHYIAELFGCALRFDGLTAREHTESSTIRYLYQFADSSENPIFKLDGRNNGLLNLLLSRDIDIESVKKRFGFDPHKTHPTRLIMKQEGGSLLSFGPNFQSCFLNNCLIINKYLQFYRMKDILYVSIVSKTLDLETFVAEENGKCHWPVNNTNALYGIHNVPSNIVESYKLSGQFANVFLVPGIREPNVGKFLHKNPPILTKALNCSEFLYEKPFKWLEGNRNPAEDHIQPDFMLKSSATCYWDICDIKKPLLDRENLTKGGHPRRRFIDGVSEGIAQLANYDQYFSYPVNVNHAKERYGIEIQTPQLILVIGNYENTDIQEIKEASRSIKDNYTIIDYDSLNVAYLAGIRKGIIRRKAELL
jgi:hypothetical protein